MKDTIGQRISQCRKAAGFSQEALGERVGVSRQAISKWEADAAMPEIDKLVALSRLFQVSVGWLLGEEEKSSTEDPVLDRIEALLKSQPRWQKPLLIATAICAALSLGLSLYNLRDNRQPSAENLVESLFQESAQLLKDSYIHAEPWEDWQGAELTFTLTPEGYTPGESGWIQVLSGGETVESVPCTYDQGFWTAQVSLPAAQDYTYQFLLETPEGDRQQTLYTSDLSDLGDYLFFSVGAYCERVSTRPGYFTLHKLILQVLLPQALENRNTVPKWEQLDLVFFLNGEELYRKDYRYVAEEGSMNHSGAGISAPVEQLNADDKITACVQARLDNGLTLDQMVFGWQILADGAVQELFSLGVVTP